MLMDVFTIIRKEWKEMLLMRGSLRSGLTNLLLIFGVFGVFMPLQSSSEWFSTPLMPILWSWIPVFMTTWMVADAIAGERERHTLETLLASRLSDRAILIGKVGAAVLYGLCIQLVNLLLAAITVNVAHPENGIRFYDPLFFLELIGFTFLGCTLLSSLGVLVSLRSATARQAYQRLSVVLLIVCVLPTIVLQFIPQQIKTTLFATLEGLDFYKALGMISLALVMIDTALLVAAFKRFKRSQLVLA